MLRRALEVDPDLASAHFFLAMALKTFGEYDEALVAPAEGGRASTRGTGWSRTRLAASSSSSAEYQEAIGALERVLAVDPEDLQAHYTLMLAWQGAGDGEQARTHQALYRRFKADESAQAITGPYRQLHPHDNNERQPVHEHRRPREAAPAAGETR